MRIESRKVASIDYTLTDSDGNVLDSSKDDGPLSYLHGFDNIVPGLEAALEGKAPGDHLSVEVAAKDGYGERDETLVQSIPRSRFPAAGIEVGAQFHAESDGHTHVVTVVGVDGEAVTIDANHPLAGETLHFDVTVTGVRDATEEEIAHGHVHDGEHHHHH
jgi:FKBP-type peptidyl-prolyl cis-trans isomerase SlyD